MKQQHIVENDASGERLDRFASQVFDGLSRTEARRRISAGELFVNGKPCRVQSRKVWKGDRVTWVQSKDTKAEALRNSREVDWSLHGGRPSFLYQDRHVAILDKRSGIPIEPTPKEDLRTCLRQVESFLRESGVHHSKLYATPAHRLDAGASGAVAFATSKSAAKGLSTQFATRSASRLYRALVVGHMKEEEGTLRHELARTGPGIRRGVVKAGKGKAAISHYKVIQRFEEATLIQVKLETGRTHQIRVQFSHIGHPLLGDWLYCPPEEAERCPRASRLMLHAYSLTLIHPQTEEVMNFISPLHEDFDGYLKQLQPQDSETCDVTSLDDVREAMGLNSTQEED